MTETRHPRRPGVPVRALLLALSLAVLGGGWGAPGGVHAKSRPPASLMWQVDSTAGPDGAYGVALTVSAAVAFVDLAVEITVPAGVSVVEGATRWNGPLRAGEAHTLSLRVRVSQPAAIGAKISGKTASNVHFMTAVTAHVPESNDKKPAPLSPGAATDGPTPRVREYRSP